MGSNKSVAIGSEVAAMSVKRDMVGTVYRD